MIPFVRICGTAYAHKSPGAAPACRGSFYRGGIITLQPAPLILCAGYRHRQFPASKIV